MRQDLHARDVRLRGALVTDVGRRQRALERVRGALALHSPARSLPLHRERLAARSDRLTGDIRAALMGRRRQLEAAGGRLEALSPLRVIDRGYSITVDDATGAVVTSAAEVGPGSLLRTRLAHGSVLSEVVADGVAPDRERMYDVGPGQSGTSEDDDHG